MIGPTDAYVLKTVHDLGISGDASKAAVVRDLGGVVRDVGGRVDRMIGTGHLQLVGGHLAVSATGLAVVEHDNAHNPISNHERNLGLKFS